VAIADQGIVLNRQRHPISICNEWRHTTSARPQAAVG
jgi:hypothetical protein